MLVVILLLAFPTAFANWQPVSGDETTKCGRGGDFTFFNYEGSENNLMIFLQGGGGCWSGASCANAVQWTSSIAVKTLQHTLNQGLGILNTKKDNAMANWNKIYIPYCTGDAHTGNSTQKYGIVGGTVNHWGSRNLMFALDWAHVRWPDVGKVLIAGCSAGSVGSYMATWRVFDMWPNAEHYHFGDSYLPIFGKNGWNKGFVNWPLTASIPDWIEKEKYSEWSHDVTAEMLNTIASHYPEASVNSFSHTHDMVQTTFYEAEGAGAGPSWHTYAFDVLNQMVDGTDNYHVFIEFGFDHCISPLPAYYTAKADGVHLNEWVNSIVNGEDIPDITGNVRDMITYKAPGEVVESGNFTSQ